MEQQKSCTLIQHTLSMPKINVKYVFSGNLQFALLEKTWKYTVTVDLVELVRHQIQRDFQ